MQCGSINNTYRRCVLSEKESTQITARHNDVQDTTLRVTLSRTLDRPQLLLLKLSYQFPCFLLKRFTFLQQSLSKIPTSLHSSTKFSHPTIKFKSNIKYPLLFSYIRNCLCCIVSFVAQPILNTYRVKLYNAYNVLLTQ